MESAGSSLVDATTNARTALGMSVRSVRVSTVGSAQLSRLALGGEWSFFQIETEIKRNLS